MSEWESLSRMLYRSARSFWASEVLNKDIVAGLAKKLWVRTKVRRFSVTK